MRSLSSISVVVLIVLTPMGFESVKAASGSGPAERRAADPRGEWKPSHHRGNGNGPGAGSTGRVRDGGCR